MGGIRASGIELVDVGIVYLPDNVTGIVGTTGFA